MSEIKKITDERERQNDKDRTTQRLRASYSESVRAKWFRYEFKLICKVSLISKSNLEFA